MVHDQGRSFPHHPGRAQVLRIVGTGRAGFCADCGTQIVFRYFGGSEGTDITAASLDDPEAVEPEFQIFAGSRIGWMHGFDTGLPTRKHKFED